ncbi:protein tyrosine phosphatase [Paracoccus aurantiacus]|uniref:Protein tyrosine phosphatase n=1 Tax=Paracoccus aurantiacus TaxID=2599412 RepID=A0A5C6S5X9_9RHOB|nr:tyrosine-protein phosphatase [Paracoccus aurantiacus]TXB69024.1 protein tyrosine phosphatase [Paracoccus aurantiacus]
MWRAIRRGLAVLGILLIGCIGYLAYLQLSGNFHEVSPGAVYRAAQMDGQKLVRWNRDHKIASVLNLRGQDDGTDWYETEKAVTDRLGIKHIDFRMSASSELTADEARKLIEIMRDAPKPMLIHCKSGADRTGLASALYVAGIDGGTEGEAERQLSAIYGHIGLPAVSAAYAMDKTWERMEPELGFYDS